MPSKYQTLSGFIRAPFNTKEGVDRDTKYSDMYRKAISDKVKIRLFAITTIGDSYFYHIKVPSDSSAKQGFNMEYDVVIRFFSDNPEVLKESHLQNYYIQFYSNSPSFVYTYAYLYNQNGYLIHELYGKTDKDNIDKPPEKTNTNMTLSYDKSIYFACRYLLDMKFRLLTKNGPAHMLYVPDNRFFKNISDYETARLTRELLSEEKKLSDKVNKEKNKKGADPKRVLKKVGSQKTTKVANEIRKITAGGRKSKISARKSTRH